jgi:hypothetical protein
MQKNEGNVALNQKKQKIVATYYSLAILIYKAMMATDINKRTTVL